MPTPPEAMDGPWTIRTVLDWSTGYLRSRGVDSPRLDAEVLLAWSLNVERIRLYMDFDKPLSPPERDRFRQALGRRGVREPVAYITGVKEFWGLPLAVGAGVLIPRPETEHLVAAALELIPKSPTPSPWRILDLGTGSGAIPLALASERPGHSYFALDRSAAAIAAAHANARQLAATVGPIHLFYSDWTAAISPHVRFDLVTANPPYIPSGDLAALAPEIRSYEPRTALDGGADGLTDLIRILCRVFPLMGEAGHLLMEIGADQAAALTAAAAADGRWSVVGLGRDFAGQDRVVILAPRRKPASP